MSSASIPAWLENHSKGVVIKIVVQPKASKTEIIGPHGEPPRLKIRIAAPPVEGEANEELLRFLRKLLKCTSSEIGILRGESSKQKDILYIGVSATKVLEKLGST